MLIELYVGTLTRYYSEQWQNANTRAGKLSPFTGPRGANSVSDPVELQGIVAEWLETASTKLKEHLTEPLNWREGMSPDYKVGEIGFQGYGGAILLSAYTVTGHLPRPTSYLASWNKDPAIEILSREPGNNAIWEIMNCSLWMPCSFQFGIGMKDPSGQPIRAGSVEVLWSALQQLNEANWKASPEEIFGWLKYELNEDVSFDTQAKFGFAMFHEACRMAREKQLPIKLHY
jgi:hypothetical protein